MSDIYDNSLRTLAVRLTKLLQENEDGSIQKEQVELLMTLEERFRKHIIIYTQSREVYKQFILCVAVTNRNILSARPYFREKAKVFSKQVTPAIKDGNIKSLQQFHINFNFIKFVKDNWKGPFPEKAQVLYNKIIQARTKLIENNMPLAINRAKLFYRKVPQSHLSLMDLIGIAGMGLISGVDKWVGEYTRVFNGVCIGRMTGNLIDSYSETTLHFYPSDKSILYRTNSLRFRHDIQDLDLLAKVVNESYKEDVKKGIRTPKNKVTPNQLFRLLSAASPVSADSAVENEEGNENLLDVYMDANNDSPEEVIVKKDLLSKLFYSIDQLPAIQQKVLKLKGVGA